MFLRGVSESPMRQIWLNGELLPESEARVSVYDDALMFGSMVFEMLRTFNLRPFKLREHLERLRASAEMTGLSLPYTLDELEYAHDQLLEANRPTVGPTDELRTLINVSRGTLPIYHRIVPKGAWAMMMAFPLRWVLEGTSSWYDTGVDGFIPVQRTIPAQLMDPKIKHRSRLYLKLAALEAKKPSDWPILLDPDGFLAESTGANVFLVKKGRVYTPEPRNCLRGISRQYVMDLLARQSRPAVEKNLEPYDLHEAEEAFFACTPYSILPCVSLNGRLIGEGKPGPVTKGLMQHWSQNVGCDFVKQAKGWDHAGRT